MLHENRYYMLTERFDAALQYAVTLHRAQRRKGTALSYFAHLMAVAALVLEHGGDEDQAIAGLLHDAAEDQGRRERIPTFRRGPGLSRLCAVVGEAGRYGGGRLLL